MWGLLLTIRCQQLPGKCAGSDRAEKSLFCKIISNGWIREESSMDGTSRGSADKEHNSCMATRYIPQMLISCKGGKKNQQQNDRVESQTAACVGAWSWHPQWRAGRHHVRAAERPWGSTASLTSRELSVHELKLSTVDSSANTNQATFYSLNVRGLLLENVNVIEYQDRLWAF